MMKKKRTVIIIDPKLQRIRNKLREVLIQAKSEEWRKNFVEQQRINKDKFGNFRKLTPLQKKRVSELEEKLREIERMTKRSIIQCPTCNMIDKDMTFNHVLREWY